MLPSEKKKLKTRKSTHTKKTPQCGQSAGVFTYCQQEVQGEASLHPAHIQSAKCLSAVL